jgi:uncharacterized membrane-anchored protein
LRKFNFKNNFESDEDKDTYIRQIEEMIRQRERENAEMEVIITGMKRQIVDDGKSVSSKVEDLPSEGVDFFDD